MKTFFIIILCTIISIAAFAQQKSREVEEVKVTPPRFTGTNYVAKKFQEEKCESIYDYLRCNLQYPEKDLKKCCEGTELVQFEITPKGELTNIIVTNGISPGIDEAVINLLKSTNGMWVPGQNNGEPVAMEKEISIAFKYGAFETFTESKDFVQLAKLFLEKGNKNLLVKNNPKRALKFYKRGIRYMPNEDCLLLASGICKYELGDTEGARSYWKRMSISGIDFEAENTAKNFSELNGYEELTVLLEK